TNLLANPGAQQVLAGGTLDLRVQVSENVGLAALETTVRIADGEVVAVVDEFFTGNTEAFEQVAAVPLDSARLAGRMLESRARATDFAGNVTTESVTVAVVADYAIDSWTHGRALPGPVRH